jgi:hypothetical protein
VAQLAHPSLDALGGAYVEGRVELEGPMNEVIRIGDALSQVPAFYELLALFDALRMGQARERELASRLLEERLK